MTSVFTKIINGDLPGEFVWRDETCVGFMSINPLSVGHVLVVPIAEIDHWLDLPDDLASHLLLVAKRIGAAQQRAFAAPRVGLVIAGFEVPHVHLHVFPTNTAADFNFANAAVTVDPAELSAAAARIRQQLSQAEESGANAEE